QQARPAELDRPGLLAEPARGAALVVQHLDPAMLPGHGPLPPSSEMVGAGAPVSKWGRDQRPTRSSAETTPGERTGRRSAVGGSASVRRAVTSTRPGWTVSASMANPGRTTMSPA